MSAKKNQALAARAASLKVWVSLAALWLAAFALRAIFLNAHMDAAWPFSIFYYGDSRHYRLFAEALLDHQPYDAGLPNHPPLTAWILAGVFGVLGRIGRDAQAMKLAFAALSALLVPVAIRAYRDMLPAGWSGIASVLMFFSTGLLILGTGFHTEATYPALLMASVWLLWRQREYLSWRAAAGLGFITGITALCRAEHLSLWPFFIFYLWLLRDRARPLREHLSRWGLALVVSLLVVAPWTLHNWRAISEFNATTPALEPLPRLATVSAYGPLNFSMANYDGADGGFNPGWAEQFGAFGALDIFAPGPRHSFIHGYAEGFHWLREHPTAALKLEGLKLNRWLDGFRLGWGISGFPAGFAGGRPPVDLVLPESPWGGLQKWLLVILASCGAVMSFRKIHHAFSICALILIHRAFITLAFFGYARALVMLWPVIIPLLLLPFLSRWPQWPPRKLQMAAFVFATLFTLTALIAVSRPPQQFQATGSPDPETHTIIQDDWIAIWPKGEPAPEISGWIKTRYGGRDSERDPQPLAADPRAPTR